MPTHMSVIAAASSKGKGAAHGSYGGIVEVKDASIPFGSSQTPQGGWAIVGISDLEPTDPQVTILKERWGITRTVQAIDWDAATDVGTLQFVGSNVNSLGDGEITRILVERPLRRWALSITWESDNDVRAAANIAQMGMSEAFLGIDPTAHAISHLGYANPTHTFRVDMPQETTAEQFLSTRAQLESRGCTVINVNSGQKRFDYELTRTTIRDRLQMLLDRDNASDGRYHQWRIKTTQMDALMAGTLPGQTDAGYYTGTIAQIQSIVENMETV